MRTPHTHAPLRPTKRVLLRQYRTNWADATHVEWTAENNTNYGQHHSQAGGEASAQKMQVATQNDDAIHTLLGASALIATAGAVLQPTCTVRCT